MIKNYKDLISGINSYIRNNESSEIVFGENKIFRDEESEDNYFLTEIGGKEFWILFQRDRYKREKKSWIHIYDDNREKKSLLQYTIDDSNFEIKGDKFILIQKRGITIGRKAKGLKESFDKKMIDLGFDENGVITSGSSKSPNYSVIIDDILFWIDARTSTKLELEEKYRNIENQTFNSEDEIGDIETKTEGGKKVVISVKAERSAYLRKKAIEFHGTICKVCGFDFQETYGIWGKKFIEVHHLIPVAEHGKRETDVKKDLTVVCSNCHRMIHRKKGLVLTVEELKKKTNL